VKSGARRWLRFPAALLLPVALVLAASAAGLLRPALGLAQTAAPSTSSTPTAVPNASSASTSLPATSASSPPATLDAGVADGSPPDGGKVWASCSEYLPKGARRPRMTVKLPRRAISGYAVRLTVIITHGPGETVLPAGFRVNRASHASKALEEAGFTIPEPDGGSPPGIDRADPESAAGKKELTSTLSLPFVPLPKEAGRQRLVLPPVPIAVGRANGQVMTLCTRPQALLVEDPIANEVDPKVKPNPPPQPQREPWPLAKQVAFTIALALVLALLGLWLLHRWKRRPQIEPPKPRVLPWIAAMAELDEIRRSELLDEERFDEHVDRVNDCVRRYLGDRYGFDGIESTSTEIRALLKRVYPPLMNLEEIYAFLDETDLVKFAKASARREDCMEVMDRAEQIIIQTTPEHPERFEDSEAHRAERAA